MTYNIFIVNTFSTAIGALLIIFFFHSIYELKMKPRTKILFIFLFSLINGFLSTILTPVAIKPIILIIINTFIIIILLKATLFQSFISLALYTIGLAVGDSLSVMVLSYILRDMLMKSIQSNIIYPLLGNIFANIFAFLLFLLLKPFRNYIRILNRNKFLYVLTAFTIIVIASSFALHYYMDAFNFTAYIIISIVIISYCIFTILIWFSTLRKAINDEELFQQNFYNESLRSTLFDLRRFKHDWVNNLTVIYSMLKMNKINELNQYVSELIVQNTEQSNTEIFNIKNAGLFGIISSKINQAKENGITVELSVIGEVENIPRVKISELCEIIGIFLDNAIEEAVKASNSISVAIRKSEMNIEISISNSCLNIPDMKSIYNEGYSTKGENRGMGLAIARHIIERNKYILHMTSYEDDIFTHTLEIVDGKGL